MEFFDDPLQDIEGYDEWIKNVIKAPNIMKKKYDVKMKAILIQHFYKRKIQEQTGVRLNKIRWNQLPEDVIILWPDKTKKLFELPLKHLNGILGRLDLLHFSEESLKNIKLRKHSGVLTSKITEYFRDHFQYIVIDWKKKIPWDKLTSADFENWPEDVPVKSPRNLPPNQRKKVSDVLKTIKLSDHFKKTYKMRLGYSRMDKQALISRHLLNRIKKRTGISNFRLPVIYPGEISHWPALKPVNPRKLSALDLDYVFQNLNALELSEACIERLEAVFKSKNLIYEVREHIRDMLKEISDKRKNIKVHWSKIQRDSFTWWPAGIQVRDPKRLHAADLRRILENKDKIKFTHNFKGEYLKYLDSTV